MSGVGRDKGEYALHHYTQVCIPNMACTMVASSARSWCPVNTDVRAYLFADQGCVPAVEGQRLAVSGPTFLKRMRYGVHVYKSQSATIIWHSEPWWVTQIGSRVGTPTILRAS